MRHHCYCFISSIFVLIYPRAYFFFLTTSSCSSDLTSFCYFCFIWNCLYFTSVLQNNLSGFLILGWHFLHNSTMTMCLLLGFIETLAVYLWLFCRYCFYICLLVTHFCCFRCFTGLQECFWWWTFLNLWMLEIYWASNTGNFLAMVSSNTAYFPVSLVALWEVYVIKHSRLSCSVFHVWLFSSYFSSLCFYAAFWQYLWTYLKPTH